MFSSSKEDPEFYGSVGSKYPPKATTLNSQHDYDKVIPKNKIEKPRPVEQTNNVVNFGLSNIIDCE